MKNEIKVHLLGDLGNQLFQYSAALILSHHKQMNFVLDNSVPLAVFGEDQFFKHQLGYFVDNSLLVRSPYHVGLRYKYKRIVESFSKNIMNDLRVSFDEMIKSNLNHYELFGYWQNNRHLSFHRDLIVSGLGWDKTIVNLLKQKPLPFDYDNDIAVHLRLGDYENSSVMASLSENYFLNSIKYLKSQSKSDNSNIHIFTNEIKSQKCDFLSNIGCKIVEHQSLVNDPILTLACMSKFKKIVISNSTFSWWAAYLGESEKLIVRPKKWFNFKEGKRTIFCPSEWVSM